MDVRAALKGQYHASLAMLKTAIDKCPKDLWDGGDYPVAFWRVAYHTLFYTHFYLSRDAKSFRPWKGHRQEPQLLAALTRPTHRKMKIRKAFTRKKLLTYWKFCDALVDEAVDGMDLEAKRCGFWWYKVSKFEHQLINIRHVQHHTAMLAARLRCAGGKGVVWIGTA